MGTKVGKVTNKPHIMSYLVGHSAGKCDVIGPKNHVPMGTKVEKVPNKLYQGHLHSMWTFRQKIILAPGVPMGGPKVPRAHVLGSKNFFGLKPSK